MKVHELIAQLAQTDLQAEVEIVTDMAPFTTWEELREVFEGCCPVTGVEHIIGGRVSIVAGVKK